VEAVAMVDQEAKPMVDMEKGEKVVKEELMGKVVAEVITKTNIKEQVVSKI
jgi:hypothetical protein